MFIETKLHYRGSYEKNSTEGSRYQNPDGWREANKRLYEYLSSNSEELPDNIEKMEPLFLAAMHGCKAGLHEKVLHDLYLPRVMRRNNFYALKNLGAVRPVLSVLSYFFKDGKEQPVDSLCNDDKVVLLTQKGTCLAAAKSYAAPEVKTAFSTALDLLKSKRRTVGQKVQERDLYHFFALWGTWVHSLVSGEVREAHNLVEDLITLAKKLKRQEPTVLTEAYRLAGTTSFWRGNQTKARHYLKQAINHYTSGRNYSFYLADPKVNGLSYEACVLWFLGYPDQALKKSRDALGLADKLKYPFSTVIANIYASWVRQYRGEVQDAQNLAEKAAQLTEEQGLDHWHAGATILLGWIKGKKGCIQEGKEQILNGIKAWKEGGAGLILPYYYALLSEVYIQGEESIDDGLCDINKAIDEAIDDAEKNNEHFYDAELYRLRGELLLKQNVPDNVPDIEEAKGCFRRAITKAKDQSAKSLVLHAAISFAKLMRTCGNESEAKEAKFELGKVYRWFKEGYETADLQEAKKLLEAIS